MITIEKKENPKLFTGVYWATAATTKGSDRGLEYLKIEIEGEESKWVGCDGHRLHIFRYSDIDYTAGLYTCTRRTKSVIVLEDANSSEYPQYSQVIPNPDSVIKTAILDIGNRRSLAYSNFSLCAQELPKGYSLDFEYFKQLTDIPGKRFKMMMYRLNKSTSALLFKKKNYFGILMPLAPAKDGPVWESV